MLKALRTGSLADHFVRYVIVGGGAAIVDFGGFVVLIALGLPVLVAAATSFAVAAVVNFTFSALFAFRSPPTWRRFALFVAFALVGLAINTAATVLAVAAGAPPWLGKIIGIGTAFLFNFALNRMIVFRDR